MVKTEEFTMRPPNPIEPHPTVRIDRRKDKWKILIEILGFDSSL